MLIFCQGHLIGKDTNDDGETKDPDADQTKVKQYVVDLTNPSLDAEKDLKVASDQGQLSCEGDATSASKILDSQLSVMSMDAGSVEDEKEKVCDPGFHIGEHVSDLSPFILNYEHTVALSIQDLWFEISLLDCRVCTGLKST